MKDTEYYKLCQEIFEMWKKEQLPSKEIMKVIFQLDYVPEPYLYFNNGSRPLYILNSNPGGGINDIQIKDVVYENTYDNFAKRISEFYLDKTKFGFAHAAFNRIKKANNFAYSQNFSGIINLETFPFHSTKLNKNKALKVKNKVKLIQEYIEVLTLFLRDKPVLVLSGCDTRVSITEDTIKKSEWINHQLKIINFDLKSCNRYILKQKGNKITTALFKDRNKYLLLMAGSNNFPKSFNNKKTIDLSIN